MTKSVLLIGCGAIGKEIIKYGVYYESGVTFMIDLLKKMDAPLVIDIGANI